MASKRARGSAQALLMAACNMCMWLSILLLIFCGRSLLAEAPLPDTINLACGAEATFTDVNGTLWMPDDSYVGTGRVASVPNVSSGIFSRLRYFPEGRKNCFQIPHLQSGTRYLVRAQFLYGRYDSKTEPPNFGVAIDATLVHRVELQEAGPPLSGLQLLELILTPSKTSLSYCLISDPGGRSPVISTLEFRPLDPYIYSSFGVAWIYKAVQRLDIGYGPESVDVRDPFARSWGNDSVFEDSTPITNTSVVFATINPNSVPLQVLWSARTVNCCSMNYSWTVNPNSDHKVFLYFAELLGSVAPGDRIFDILVNDKMEIKSLDLVSTIGHCNVFMEELWIYQQDTAAGFLNISLVAHPGLQGPILNALEIYEVVRVAVATQQDNVDALLSFSTAAGLGSPWSGDPCLPPDTGWDGVTCSVGTDPPTIIALDLTGRTIWGPLPTSMKHLINLEDLSLRNNYFSGQIPPDLSALSSLKYLDLQHNQLNGTVPEYLFKFPDLKSILLQNNNFSGTIPQSILQHMKKRKMLYNFTGNPYLTSPKTSQDNIKIYIGASAGGLSLIFVMAVSAMLYFVYKRNIEQNEASLLCISPPPYIMKPLSEPVELEWLSVEVQQYTLKEVELATSNFKNMIGEGGFGAVYYGTSAHGRAIAVKVRSSSSHQGTREFYAEINLLTRVRHENLVPLLGSCSDGECQILIYPYMSNGSLQDRLWGGAARRKPLDWQTRLTIALGAARGLYFLHTGGERCIIHRDVKSSNILLDHRMVAKVADFGLSKYAPQEGDSLVSTEVRGTAGYLDPEYYATQQLTEKSDVFSFGVVLLEIICGREPLNIHLPRPEWSLVEWIRPFIRESKLQEIVDPTILGSYTSEAMWRVLEIAICSVEPHAIHRPAMADIIRELEDALIIENNASQYMASVQSLDSLCLSASDIKMPPTFLFDPSPVFPETVDSPDSSWQGCEMK